MSMIIEVINGVAYAVKRTSRKDESKSCDSCAIRKEICEQDTDSMLLCTLHPSIHYCRLTAEERAELQKAIGRGIGG